MPMTFFKDIIPFSVFGGKNSNENHGSVGSLEFEFELALLAINVSIWM